MKPTAPAQPLTIALPRVKRQPRKPPARDSVKWSVKTYTGQKLASGFDGFASALKAAGKLRAGVPVRD